MLVNGTIQAAYHSDGPVFPGESFHQALGANTAYSIGGHLIGKPAQGISGPSNFRSASGELANGAQDGARPYSFTDAHEQSAGQIRQALRPGM